MRIPRFFLASSELPPTGSELTIAHRAHVDQIRNVLRLKKGSRIDVLDMHSRVYHCEIDELTPNVVRTKVISSATAQGDPPVDLIVGMAMIKGDRFETAVQKLTEIGVRRLVPVETRHCVVRADDTTGDAKRDAGDSKKLQRWQAIAREAAEQCERASIPEINSPVKLAQFLSAFTTGGTLDIAFICTERRKAQQLHHRLLNEQVADKKSKTSKRMQIGLLIGPEGGFTDEEVVSAQNLGWEPVSLGPRILRAETAAIISAAEIICTFES